MTRTGWVESPGAGVTYPAAPWAMGGEGWLTAFGLRRPFDQLRPAGLYVAIWVDYLDPSPLTYSELLVARAVPGSRGRAVTITDIWVDSAASVAGGRELWAIPKGLGTFEHDASAGRVTTTDTWSAATASGPIARASYRSLGTPAPRVPSRGRTRQPGIDGGPDREAALVGSARPAPCRATWEMDPDGPLAWLAGARRLGSLRLGDFRMSFG